MIFLIETAGMNEWFYAKGGKQSGPVPFEQLVALARSSELDPLKDLVWNSTMKDWTPAGQVKEIFTAAPVPAPAQVAKPMVNPADPYATPLSTWNQPEVVAVGALSEIMHGSEPLDASACVKRGFDLTKRQFGNILIVGLVYFAIHFGCSIVSSLIQAALSEVAGRGGLSEGMASVVIGFTMLFNLVYQVISLYLGMGLTRVGLNFVSGSEVSVSQLFGEGGKLLRAIGASIIFWMMLVVGLLLLIFPGIYIALRYGQYLNAIVDRNLGVFESFTYSASITTNNKLPLFVLVVFSALISIAGMLLCGVGLIFAGPVAWLAMMVGYRWMQYGHRAAMDQLGTTVPMLAAR